MFERSYAQTALTFFARLVLTAMIVASSVHAADNHASARELARSYAFTAGSVSKSDPVQPVSLGSQSVDGGSPGHILWYTYKDDQAQLGPGRSVDWRGEYPRIHFVFTGQFFSGYDDPAVARFVVSKMFNASIFAYPGFSGDAWLQTSPLTQGGWYGNLDVDETGHAIPVCEVYEAWQNSLFNVAQYWDVAGENSWGTFIADTLPQSLSLDPSEYIRHPRIEYQEYEGQYVVHVLALEDSGDLTCDLDAVTYWRKVVPAATGSGTWTSMLVTDRVWANQFAIASARSGNGNVGLVWIEWPGFCNDTGVVGGDVIMMESPDAGSWWGSPTVISDPSSPYNAWVDVSSLYDSDGYLHIVYNASPPGEIDPSYICHWTNRIPGPYGGGQLSVVHVATGLDQMCGRGQTNVQRTAKPVISECNGRLYTIWQQYGDLAAGDTLDCADPAYPNRYGPQYNADIHMAVSYSLDGLLWDRSKNLTSSQTPGCDGSEMNSCDHDAYASMSRYGMNVASFGGTDWSAAWEAFAVRDVIDPIYPDDGDYLDVQYINDLMPEAARYMDDQETAIWTDNPIKWFRLPCVEPNMAPCISPWWPVTLYQAPTDWVKSGSEATAWMEVSNTCGADLLISDVIVTINEGPSGAVVVPSYPSVVSPGGSESFQVNINPGGFIHPSSGEAVVIEADISVHSNDPDFPVAGPWKVRTVVADTVVQVEWDTVSTGWDISLTVANNGNAGNNGVGRANMDFINAGECDPSQNVYLYDLTPIMMTGTGPGAYSWQPFYDDDNPEEYHFRPVVSEFQSGHSQTVEYEMYASELFVNVDSSVGCQKLWLAPTSSESYVLECWRVFSYNGIVNSGVRLGEWADWDIPSGKNGNQGGVVDNSGGVDYMYQRGIVDLAADPPPCQSEDRRLGMSGLLGYYLDSELEVNEEVNHTGLYGGHVLLDSDLLEPLGNELDPDSVWTWLDRNTFLANNSLDADQQILLSYGGFDIYPDDTLNIWTVHASVYDGDEDDLQVIADEAMLWYMENRPGPAPECECGDINCDGKFALSDITMFIDIMFIGGGWFPYEDAANVDRCGGVDYADAALFFAATQEVPIVHPSFCTGTVLCDWEPEGDTVSLVAAHEPDASLSDDLLQVDVYIENVRTVAAVDVSFTWDEVKVVFDSAVVAPFLSDAFSIREAEAVGYHQINLKLFADGVGTDTGLTAGTSRRCASFYFTTVAWTKDDVVGFDASFSNFLFVKSPYDGSDADSLGYRPKFAGPLVILDHSHCCGRYTGGYSGNANCDTDGDMTLSDVSRMIDYLYISKMPLCCHANGNTNGSEDGMVTLSDVSRLIDHLWISKLPTEICE